jgi:hypothetical protein
LADKLIGTGDELFDSTVTSLTFAREGLNNLGQIAFSAQLADGRGVTVRLSGPTVIPEPGSLTLLGLGVLGLIGYAWRRRVTV